MTSLNKSTLRAPLIGKIYALDDYLDRVAILPSKRLQRVVVEPMLIQVSLLHTQAMRELRGLDYYKRIRDILLELQAAAFRVYHKKGWTMRVASTIDAMCDDIAEELQRQHFAPKANPIKSTDEDSSANSYEGGRTYANK